jgi:L-ascorbate metabolism protein UlaG (beta-lactamase superfamily)
MRLHTEILLGPAVAGPSPERGAITFIGTATCLVRLGRFTILTDPNFLHAGDHVHLGYGMFTKRLTNPALEIEDLPPLDACVLSHFHGDHWDRIATARLPKDLPVLTTPHAARALRRRGFHRAVGLATWDSATLRRGDSWLRLSAAPGRHGPGPARFLLPPVMGSVWELGDAGAPAPTFRLYVSGDTLLHGDLRRIPRRWPGIDLGLFHLGGTRVAGLLVTLDARQGVEAVRIVNPRLAIPIHYDDYEVFRSPLQDFVRAVDEAGLSGRVHYLARGERYELELRPPRLEVAAGGAGAAPAGRVGSWDPARPPPP